MIRYIIRPPGIKRSPRTIKGVLGAIAVVNGGDPGIRLPDWEKDFFLYYPATVSHFDSDYEELRKFMIWSKKTQRKYISKHNIKTPEDYEAHEGKYVIRPLHHHSGQGWEISDHVSTDPQKYSSPLFPKRHEYRVLYSKGIKIATLKKQLPEEGIDVDKPWNHANGSSFVTVNEEQNDRLRHTSAYNDLLSLPIVLRAHLCGVDILYSRIKGSPAYAYLEVNLCPSMSIETNLNKLKEIWND